MITEKQPAFRAAVAHIYLEDVSHTDAESITIAENVVENIDHSDEETEISFRLEIEEDAVKSKNFYSVRVWIDTNGNGKPDAKDLFSNEAYRVLTHGFGSYIEIRI